MTVKFITVKGPDRLARAPFYLGIPQHERTMSKREAYEHIALKTGYTSTAVKAVFMAAAGGDELRGGRHGGRADLDGRRHPAREGHEPCGRDEGALPLHRRRRTFP